MSRGGSQSCIIHITAGLKYQTARWSLKMVMEVYGKIDACHMGNRDNPVAEPPWIKYQTREGAEKAMDQLTGGLVNCHGEVLRGEWRESAEPPKSLGVRDIGPEVYTSRDLAERDRKNRGGGGRSRSRGRGGGGRKSRSRGRGKSRDRGKRSRSREKENRREDNTYSSKHPTCPLGHDLNSIKEKESGCDCCSDQHTTDSNIMKCNECRYLICEKCAKNRVLS